MTVHPEGGTSMWTKIYDSPPNGCCGISAKTTNVNLLVALLGKGRRTI